jgi:Spy/CpxP family protein refolding chaperone
MNNRTQKVLIVGLVVSIGINLLLAGVLLGHRLGGGHPPMMPMNPMFGLMHFVRELPEERQAQLQTSLAALRSASRPAFAHMRQMQENLRTEIRRDPLDPAATRQALTALQEHLRDHQATSADAFLELLQALTPGERIALDEALRRGMKHRHGGHPSRPPHAPPPELVEPMAEPMPEPEKSAPDTPPPGEDGEVDPRAG